MADKTIGFKVNEELHDKIKNIIEFSGLNNKEWLEFAVSLYELNSIKKTSTEYEQELKELEIHTKRIYELIVNMIQRSFFIKENAIQEMMDKLEQKEKIISAQEAEIKENEYDIKYFKEEMHNLQDESSKNLLVIEELRTAAENNQSLIKEYQDKNDTLNGLLSKYQKAAEENEKLKKEIVDINENIKAQVMEHKLYTSDQQNEIDKLRNEIDLLKVKHVDELTRLTEKMEIERDKKILEIERFYQAKLSTANEEYNKTLRDLYKEREEKNKNK